MLSVGLNSTFEDRTGGDIRFIEGNGDELHSWFEKNRTRRFSTQIGFDSELSEKLKLTLKNSIGYFDRALQIPDFSFAGTAGFFIQ